MNKGGFMYFRTSESEAVTLWFWKGMTYYALGPLLIFLCGEVSSSCSFTFWLSVLLNYLELFDNLPKVVFMKECEDNKKLLLKGPSQRGKTGFCLTLEQELRGGCLNPFKLAAYARRILYDPVLPLHAKVAVTIQDNDGLSLTLDKMSWWLFKLPCVVHWHQIPPLMTELFALPWNLDFRTILMLGILWGTTATKSTGSVLSKCA